MSQASATSVRQPGVLCWPGLATTDIDAAIRFYGDLFGWASRRLSRTDNRAFTLRADAVALVYRLTESELEAGVTPQWSALVKVNDLVDSALDAVDLNGRARPRPVPVTSDSELIRVTGPGGGSLCLWRSESHPIADRFAGAGAWQEACLLTDDLDTTKEFYSSLLGWTFLPRGESVEVSNSGDVVTRIQRRSPFDGTTGWTLSFRIAGLSAVSSMLQSEDYARKPKIESIGPSTVLLADPQGAMLRVNDSTGCTTTTQAADELLG